MTHFNLRDFTNELIDEIIDTYNNSRPMRIYMITRGRCYICNRKDLTPLDIDVTYDMTCNAESNMSRRTGWIHCKNCAVYIRLFQYYNSPYSLNQHTDKYIGTPVKLLRNISTIIHPESRPGVQHAVLGSGVSAVASSNGSMKLYQDEPTCMFTMLESNKLYPWNGRNGNCSLHITTLGTVRYREPTKPSCVVHAAVSFVSKRTRDRHGNYKQLTKWVPLSNLIMMNPDIFGYKLEDSKIIPSMAPNWIEKVRHEYKRANKILEEWRVLIWCLMQTGTTLPREIERKIFKMWFNMNTMNCITRS